VFKLKDFATGLFRIGNLWEAASALTSCLAAACRLSKADRALLHANRALVFLSLREWAMALEDAEAALSLDSRNLKAQFRVAKASLELGDFARAEFFAEKVLEQTEDAAARKVLDEAKERMKVETGRVPDKLTCQAPAIECQTPTKLKTFQQIESFLRHRIIPDKLCQVLPPEELAYYSKHSKVLLSDPDIFANCLHAIDQVTDRDKVGKYFEVLRSSPSTETMVAMMIVNERQVYSKLTNEFT